MNLEPHMKAAERVLARARPHLKTFDPNVVIVIVQAIVQLLQEWQTCHQDKPLQLAGKLRESIFRTRSIRFVRRALLTARMDETQDHALGNAIIDELFHAPHGEVEAILAA